MGKILDSIFKKNKEVDDFDYDSLSQEEKKLNDILKDSYDDYLKTEKNKEPVSSVNEKDFGDKVEIVVKNNETNDLLAKEKFKDSFLESEASLSKNYNDGLSKFGSSKKDVEENNKKAQQDILFNKEKKQEQAKIKAINNGIENSSIYENMQDNINNDIEKKQDEKNVETKDKLIDIDLKIEELQLKYEKAIKNNDTTYANKIEKEAVLLKKQSMAEYQKLSNSNSKIDKNIEYAKKQADKDKVAYEKAVKQEKIDEQNYGYSKDKQKNFEERLDKAIEFYASFPKEKAIEAIKNNRYLTTYLGNNYGKLIMAVNNS